MSLTRQILQDNPVGYWPLDEVSGTTAFDRSGNGRNGTYTGAVTLNARDMVPGSKGPDFIGGYVSLGDMAAWSPHAGAAGVMTLEAFIRGDTFSSASILTKRATSNYEWSFYATGGNILAALMEPAPGGTAVTEASSDKLVIGILHHIAWTYNRATPLTIVYLDGVEVARSTAFTGNSADTGAEARIGGSPVDIGAFDGSIAHAALFPTELSAARIKAHYEAGIRNGVSF